MTRNREIDLEDLTNCEHAMEIPVCDEEGGTILYWRCRCGAKTQPVNEDEKAGES